MIIFNRFIPVKYPFLKQFNFVKTINNNTCKYLIVCIQMSSGSFENNVTYKIFTYNIDILSSTDRSISFYQNSSVLLHGLDSGILGSKPGWLICLYKILPLSHEHKRMKFKRLWITIVIVYLYPLNGYRELDSYEEPYITFTSFDRELNPTGVGEHIYIYIYIYCHPQTDLFRSIGTLQCGYTG